MTVSLPCVRGMWPTSSTSKTHADYRSYWLGSELLETFFRVWVPCRRKSGTLRGGQKTIGVTGFDGKQPLANFKEMRLIFHTLAVRRMAASIYRCSPLIERCPHPVLLAPQASPQCQTPLCSQREASSGPGGLSMLMPTTPRSVCLGLQSTLLTSNCSERAGLAGFCPSCSDFLSAGSFAETEARLIKTFSVKAHPVVLLLQAPKASNVWNCNPCGPARCHCVLNPVFSHSRKCRPQSRSFYIWPWISLSAETLNHPRLTGFTCTIILITHYLWHMSSTWRHDVPRSLYFSLVTFSDRSNSPSLHT